MCMVLIILFKDERFYMNKNRHCCIDNIQVHVVAKSLERAARSSKLCW